MNNLKPVELKTFVPSKDFELSKRFYQDLGFTLAWSDDQLAYFSFEHVSFLLQNFYVQEWANNFMMHLLVEDVDAWHTQIVQSGIGQRYGVSPSAVQLQPWRMRDFTFIDPAGVLWRIGQNAD